MDAIQEILKIDFSYLFISVFVILIGIKAVVSLFEWVTDKLGLETKWMKRKREDRELLKQTAANLVSLQNRQLSDRQVSTQHDKMIKSDLSKLSDTIDGIIIRLDNMQNKIDQTEIAKLKSQILSYYRKYKDVGEWDKFESDVFWDLYESYISHGGNSFVKQDIEPIMRNLDVKS